VNTCEGSGADDQETEEKGQEMAKLKPHRKYKDVDTLPLYKATDTAISTLKWE